jgi:hypothetical protein
MHSLSALGTYPPQWLSLRESADAAARSVELVDLLLPCLPDSELVIRDLGCGTGSMGRWLAGQLPGPQRWILHDRDPGLLALAVASLRTATAEQCDITRLCASDLAGTSLVTGSALLDLLTADEVVGLASACVEAGCPALFTVSVVGRVELTPADPLDAEFSAAFNAHQRRTTDGRRLLGPDAVDVAVHAFERLGALVYRRPSPWRLGQATLTAEWLKGWVVTACEQQPDLAASAEAYVRRRLEVGELRAVVHHSDLLALPKVGR